MREEDARPKEGEATGSARSLAQPRLVADGVQQSGFPFEGEEEQVDHAEGRVVRAEARPERRVRTIENVLPCIARWKVSGHDPSADPFQLAAA